MNKEHTYVLGSNERTYNTISAMDIDCYVDDELLPGTTYLEYSEEYVNGKKEITGTIGMVVFNETSIQQLLENRVFDLCFRSTNDFGKTSEMKLIGVKIEKTIEGLTVDDISVEEKGIFKAERVERWYKIKGEDV